MKISIISSSSTSAALGSVASDGSISAVACNLVCIEFGRSCNRKSGTASASVIEAASLSADVARDALAPATSELASDTVDCASEARPLRSARAREPCSGGSCTGGKASDNAAAPTADSSGNGSRIVSSSSGSARSSAASAISARLPVASRREDRFPAVSGLPVRPSAPAVGGREASASGSNWQEDAVCGLDRAGIENGQDSMSGSLSSCGSSRKPSV
mmetsp:Transcript_156727/g.300601  ORF Transcript_156727/g.300601 Transcript_156727/m.300601 type:complete len:217 (+) Transcript_156727:207-857(+)